MKKSKRFLSSLLAVLMVFSVWSVGFSTTAVAVDSTSGSSRLNPIVLEPIARPEVKFYCTEITRIAKEAGSMEIGNQIVKATPSGVPETSGTYVAQAYAGETPAATRVTFQSNTTGISITGFSCSNSTVVLSAMSYDAANGAYYVDIVSGTANAGEAITFTVDYTWIDGKTYQDKCVTYVENIETGGAYARLTTTWKPYSGLGSWYRGAGTANVRLLGKGVYYSQPDGFTTVNEVHSGSEGYDTTQSFGVYNVATGAYLINVGSGYNTSIYERERWQQSGTNPARENTHQLFIPYTAKADVYIDSSASTTLSDINLRMDSNAGEEYSRNNDTPAIALTDSWVFSGYISSDPGTYANDATASATLGYNVPAKANYGMEDKDGSIASVSPGVRQYEHILTVPLTGAVSGIADGATYTIINRYHSYFVGSKSMILNAPYVATPITFHIVDKSVLREAIDFVLNSEPTTPIIRNNNKGKNPQSWYYKSGFQAFQTSYIEALRVLNNPKALQTEIDSAAKGLKSSYNGLVFNPADYKEVNALSDQADAILENRDSYDPADIAVIEEALDMVKSGYNILYQGAVDTMAANLREALKLAPLPADYSAVDAAIEDFNSKDETLYTKGSWATVEAEIAKVDRTLDATEQATVDGYAAAIVEAIKNLVPLVADFTTLKLYVDEANAINKDYYINGSVLTDVVEVAQEAIDSNEAAAWPMSRQGEVDTLARNLRDTIDSLVSKSANKVALKAAIDAEVPGNLNHYNQTLLGEYNLLIAEGTELYNDSTLTMAKDQDTIDAKTAEITAKYEELMASYALPANKDALKAAIDQKLPGESQYYDQILLGEFNDLVAEGTLMYNDKTLNEKNQAEIDAKTAEINAKYAEVLATYFIPANKTALKAAIDAEFSGVESYYDQDILAEYKALVAEGQEMYLDTKLSKDDQAKIDAKTAEIEAKYEELLASYRERANKVALKTAIDAPITGNEAFYNQTLLNGYKALVVEATEMYNDDSLTTEDQTAVDAMTAELTVKYDELMASYRDPGEANKEALNAAITAAEEKIATGNYADDEAMAELNLAIEAGKALVADETLNGDNQAEIDAAAELVNAAAEALTLKAADFTALTATEEALAALKAETLDVVTYIDGVLGTETKAKYDVSAIEAKIAEFKAGSYTILDNETINAFAAEIEADIAALTALAYAEYLVVAVAEYEETDLAPYTAATVEVYTNAYNVAKALENADQTAINEAVTALAKAKQALQIAAYFEAKEGTTTVVDKENGIIYGLEEGISDLENFVTYEGGVLQYEYTDNGFGTGAVVNFVVNGEVKETYTIVIYGDLTGDGVVDGFDYSILASMANGDIEVSDVVNMAADLNFDGAADTFDMAVLGAVTVGEAQISQIPEI